MALVLLDVGSSDQMLSFDISSMVLTEPENCKSGQVDIYIGFIRDGLK